MLGTLRLRELCAVSPELARGIRALHRHAEPRFPKEYPRQQLPESKAREQAAIESSSRDGEPHHPENHPSATLQYV